MNTARNQYMREWKKKNAEKVNQYQKNYRKKHPEKTVQYEKRRREKNFDARQSINRRTTNGIILQGLRELGLKRCATCKKINWKESDIWYRNKPYCKECYAYKVKLKRRLNNEAK